LKAEGGTPGTPGDADEPSGGVVPIIETAEKGGAHLMTPLKLKTPILIPLNHYQSEEITPMDALLPLRPKTCHH